ncbi:uncharacterized protein [Palaemon carinicauda]|uniref:uncharacterized protein n=1 Tax=Palaemon carinicauda TaxID=392227 RepID=UPI0035B60516
MARLRQTLHNRRSGSRSGSNSSLNSDTDSLDMSAVLKLIPKFDEEDVTKYFMSFEKLMNRVGAPKRQWTLYLQSVLSGKAHSVYSCLSDDESKDYETVKETVLSAYRLVPEAYRKKFRSLKRDDTSTYVEYGKKLERSFCDWLTSAEVDNFEDLENLVLLESFKDNISPDIKLYIEDRRETSFAGATRLADEYSLTHGLSGSKKKNDLLSSKAQHSKSSSSNNDNRNRDYYHYYCYTCGKEGHISRYCRNQWAVSNSEVICYNCNKKGHIARNCTVESTNVKKPVSLVNNLSSGRNNLLKETRKHYGEFLSEGLISSLKGGDSREVVLLRDTGAAVSLVRRESVPRNVIISMKEKVMLGGFPNTCVVCPLLKMKLESQLVTGDVKLAVVDTLPVDGVDIIVGNDLTTSKCVNPILSEVQVPEMIVTRSGLDTDIDYGHRLFEDSNVGNRGSDDELSISVAEETDFTNVDDVNRDDDEAVERSDVQISVSETSLLSKDELVRMQREDETLTRIFDCELDDEPENVCKETFSLKDELLCRYVRPKTGSKEEVIEQLVTPRKLRESILKLAHDEQGHLGVNKTFKCITKTYFWPKMKSDVKRYVLSCHECQMAGKPNQVIPRAPLCNIPSVGEPFENVVIDIVGPLPRSKGGNIYLLTIIDRLTRYPEAIPVRSCNAKTVVKRLLNYFSKFGLPRVIQSDNGSNFVSKYFRDKMKELGINLVTSTPYHPESQGIVERFHQTLKSCLRKLCNNFEHDWEEKLPFVLLALRLTPNDTTGFSPFDLLFGHTAKGPLEILKCKLMQEEGRKDYIQNIENHKEDLRKAWQMAKENESNRQGETKRKYDLKAKDRIFHVGDKVLVLVQKEGPSLSYKFEGPFPIIEKRGNLNYLIDMGKRRAKWLHINLLKKYNERPMPVVTVSQREITFEKNSDVLNNFTLFNSSLEEEKTRELFNVFSNYPETVSDKLGLTNLLEHDIELQDTKPIRQSPYRLSPEKTNSVRQEIKYMLDNGLIVPSESDWCSPIVLVKKEDGSDRLCIDFRKVNSVTKQSNFPLPRIEDCLDKIGNAKFISKLDLAKGYWQVPLSSRAQKISAFITPFGSYEPKVMAFGLRNAASTFQRLMNRVLNGIDNCVVYLDDLVIFSDTWEQHLRILAKVLSALEKAKLVLNLKKCEFGKTSITYLGHKVGLGKICPKDGNIEAIINFPIPTSKKQAMRFIGMISYFRRFVPNFSEISAPITNLFKKGRSFVFDNDCIEAFNKLKAIMIHEPVLMLPDFSKEFNLAIDASDIGIGGVLLQEVNGIKHPVAYYSKKLNKAQQNYSTIEKELLSLVSTLQHFEIYVRSGHVLTVYTDHNPLVYLDRFKNKNKRLMRWSLELQDYDLKIVHIKGKNNVIADSLSRDFSE